MSKVWIPPRWRVQLERHTVARWIVPARTCTVPAIGASDACEVVIGWAHADVGLPPWKPYCRASLLHATATPVDAPKLVAHNGRGEQLQLPLKWAA